MPREIRKNLFALKDLPIRDLAKEANLYALRSAGDQEFEVAHVGGPPSNRGSEGTKPKGPRGYRGPRNPELCYYHSKFKHRAFKCTGFGDAGKPCLMKDVPLAKPSPNANAGRPQQ